MFLLFSSFIVALLAIFMIGAILAYCVGVFVFHVTVVKAVAQLLSQGKKFATLPVVGTAMAVLFCLLGLSWSLVSGLKLTYIMVMVMFPGLIVGFLLFSPVIVSVMLLGANSGVWLKIRDAGSICTMSAIAFAVLASMRAFIPPNW
jgi:hypothetical protein